jgi:hypothetical protein
VRQGHAEQRTDGSAVAQCTVGPLGGVDRAGFVEVDETSQLAADAPVSVETGLDNVLHTRAACRDRVRSVDQRGG